MKLAVARPADRLTVWLLAGLPSLKVIVPVGVPEPGAFAVTVAVTVTWPAVEVPVADTSTVVESWCTIWPQPLYVTGAKLGSPL